MLSILRGAEHFLFMTGIQKLIKSHSTQRKSFFWYSEPKVHLRKRHRVLQGLAGKYEVDGDVNYTQFSEACLNNEVEPMSILRELKNRFGFTTDQVLSGVADNKLPDGRRFAKWLCQQDVDEARVSRIMGDLAKLRTSKFEITVRYKDILRMADTKHFRSCFASWRGNQQVRYLADRSVALAILRDSKGDFQCRATLRLLQRRSDKQVVLGVNRVYGAGFTQRAIADGLRNKIEVYSLGRQIGCHDPSQNYELLDTFVKGPSVINNFLWEDSRHTKNEDGSATFTGAIKI